MRIVPYSPSRTITLFYAVILAAGFGMGDARAEEAPAGTTPALYVFDVGSGRPESPNLSQAQLASARQLLDRYASRTDLTFTLVGELPAGCAVFHSCPEYAILQKRIEAVATALREGSGKPAARPLSWASLPPGTGLDLTDKLALLLGSPPSVADPCILPVQIRDTDLPGTVKQPSEIAWLPAPSLQPVVVGPAIRLRLSAHDAASVGAEVWVSGPSGWTRTEGEPHDTNGEWQIPLTLDGERMSVLLARSPPTVAAQSSSAGGGQRGTGDQDMPFPQFQPRRGSAPSLAAPPGMRVICRLELVRTK